MAENIADSYLDNVSNHSSQSSSRPSSNTDHSAKQSHRKLELYLVRINPASRAVWLYMLQHDIPHILVDVDLTKEDSAPEFVAKNTHKEVPILVDGDVVVFEGPVIIRYLAMNYTNNVGFGFTIVQRMLVESLLGWANSELHRIVGYCYSYPNYLEKYQLSTEAANEALQEYGIKELTRHLESLETGYLSKGKYITGDRSTVADIYIATVLVQAEWCNFKFKMWPRVENWLKRIKSQEYWSDVHKLHNDLVREAESTCFFTGQ